ncbi:hypothetical protein B7463_g721, partial [Scytalidium lignicola]
MFNAGIPAIRWFGNYWDGHEVDFPERDGQPSTTWKLGAKLSDEKFDIMSGKKYDPDKFSPDAAWVPFLCTQVGVNDGPEHVIKVYMQIPRAGTMSDDSRSRAAQARKDVSANGAAEIEGLKLLTKGNCQSTPRLANYVQQKQKEDMWVPGGFLLFILMTKCPGTPLNGGFHEKPADERKEIRKAFEVAYKECLRCKVVNGDTGHDNLLWDNVTKTCYIVDFNWWYTPEPSQTWRDEIFTKMSRMPRMPRLLEVKAQSAREIVQTPVPNLILGRNKTFSTAIHHIRTVAQVLQWNDFERTVRQQTNLYKQQNNVNTDAMQYQNTREIWLGQIAKYMFEADCKYGFMTTYDQTVFLKQDVDPADNTKYALWVSRVIYHNTKAQKVAVGAQTAEYQSRVSLRECFMFLGLEIKNGNWQAVNPMQAAEWYQRY